MMTGIPFLFYGEKTRNWKGLTGDAMNTNRGIDIIIPVYNALTDLQRCVESILKHTDLKRHRLILVDDQSPDPQVFAWMQTLAHPGIVVLQNTKNMGFSGTVNHGITFSNRDVLVLNSDTVVTERWIEKITACAYSDPMIGMVSPFSNNATLCSIPNFCQDNEIPYGLSIEEYARKIEVCSLREYPRISVVHGFCMFIKREVLDKVGIFDAIAFEKGYGEENDICWRAEQYGYIAVLCDDTYIYHSGTTSFVGTEKLELMQKHAAILEQRYPGQMRRNDEYVRDNPHQYLRDLVNIYAQLKNGKKNILYVLHEDFQMDGGSNAGGTQLHVKDLAAYFRQENNVFVLTRIGEYFRVTAYIQEEKLTFQYYIGKPDVFTPFHSRLIAREYQQILTHFSIDLVHVHHVMNLSLDIFEVTKQNGIPLIVTLHDHYYICPTVRLLENDKTYCAGRGGNCSACLNHLAGYAPHLDILPEWQARCREALCACNVLVAPSQTVKNNYSSHYPELAERICVIQHGIDVVAQIPDTEWGTADPEVLVHLEQTLEENNVIAGYAFIENADSCECETYVWLEDAQKNRRQYRMQQQSRMDVARRFGVHQEYSGIYVQIPDRAFTSGELKCQLVIDWKGKRHFSRIMTLKGYTRREKNKHRIAVLGAICETKGSQVAKALMLQSKKKFDWYLIGQIGDPQIQRLELPNVIKTGQYQRDNIVQILTQNEIDLVCILTIGPETFCYTLSEAMAAEIPVIAFCLGAQGERIQESQIGWTLPPDMAPKEILEQIQYIFRQPELWQEKKDRVKKGNWKTVQQMCGDYENLYAQCEIPTKIQGPFEQTYFLGSFVPKGGGQTPEGNSREMEMKVQNLMEELIQIKNCFSYRLFKKLGPMIPFRRTVKRLILSAYKAKTFCQKRIRRRTR